MLYVTPGCFDKGGISRYGRAQITALRELLGPEQVRVYSIRGPGPGDFETPFPVAWTAGGRDPARGAFPGDPAPEHDPIGHLEVVANAAAYLIAPASANTVAKLAAGIADSMVTTSFLACEAPRLVAPAMNDRMYRDAATQANLQTLRQRGITVIEPEEGALASRG